ncbi:MAG: prepilin-type N-terminal cleavage/methylation domain-containing protein [Deltaproteobacteria bacterium]|nr:prepilin-type N-terminal cleavage/methylation domain-containing protein [Deltaproteobacteria bacterium]
MKGLTLLEVLVSISILANLWCVQHERGGHSARPPQQ